MLLYRQTTNGLALIEVLIALAILGIALMAIIKSTSQDIKNTQYLQNKTIANWVGTDVINQVRAKLITLPDAPGSLEQKTLALGQTWTWHGSLNHTPNPKIKEMNIEVYSIPAKNKLAHLSGFLYAA